MPQFEKRLVRPDAIAFLSSVFFDVCNLRLSLKGIDVRNENPSQDKPAKFTVYIKSSMGGLPFDEKEIAAYITTWMTEETKPEVSFIKNNMTGGFAGLEILCNSIKTIRDIERRINAVLSENKPKRVHRRKSVNLRKHES